MRGVLAGLSMRAKVFLFAVMISVASLMLFAGTGEAHGNYCGHGTYYFSLLYWLKFVSSSTTHLGHVQEYHHQYVGRFGWYTDHYDGHNCPRH